MIPLDKTFFQDDKDTHTIVFDFRVVVFKIMNSDISWEDYILDTLDKMPFHSYEVVFVNDLKDSYGKYWRQHWIDEFAPNLPEYKGTRKEKDKAYFDCYAAGRMFASFNDIAILEKEGYEADDMAATLCDLYDNVVLCSVDKDWWQLINDKRSHLFYCLGSWDKESDLLDEAQAIYQYNQKSHYRVASVSDIVVDKMIYGDAGDNLLPGSPRELIELKSICELEDYILDKLN